MKEKQTDRSIHLVRQARVMTLAVSDRDIPWSSPVYFVFHDKGFYFFSNEQARHIQTAGNHNLVSASIFQDADQMDQIFGFQMLGRLEKITRKALYVTIVKKYTAKFSFLKQIFGPGIVENPDFFLEKFKSHLYCFFPDMVLLSDNSKATEKRDTIDLNKIT